jgi:Lon protease-like protein
MPHAGRFSAVALFPLPNVVLLPRAILPLHIFEQRYKQMTADVLAGDRQIAIALLREGWEKSYYERPDIEPVVCVGTILTHEKLRDGEYNFLLQGHTRARILRELSFAEPEYRPYRVAELNALDERIVPESELTRERHRLLALFSEDIFRTTGPAMQFRKLLDSPMPTPEVADLAAFTYLDDVQVKQSLLEETNVCERVARTIHEMEKLRPRVRPLIRRDTGPSMN